MDHSTRKNWKNNLLADILKLNGESSIKRIFGGHAHLFLEVAINHINRLQKSMKLPPDKA